MLRYSVRISVKHLFLSLLWLIAISCQDKRYHSDLNQINLDTVPENLKTVYEWQKNKNAYFQDPNTSPLRPKEKKKFNGLDFFTPDSKYQVNAFFRESVTKDTIQMKTNTGSVTSEIRYGNLFFELNNRQYVLPVYREVGAEDDYVFLPFTDLTNGDLTYGGGRYLDFTFPLKETVLIDFNKAYNPYCAYNPKYSCPLVPSVNHLDIAIIAGEKSFELFRK
jgi:uncharacterized protein (DUF1684 family)